tara:strand:- start:661 stop:1566 length:906 start_codon:yes stop_codon:yes gene_type:complete
MNDEAHLQARHYRRGTILGLTLAELLMLLLFLFLLIMAFLIEDREYRLNQADTERHRWREALSEETSISLPQDHNLVLSVEDLERPIEELRQIQEESAAFRALLSDGVDVSELRQLIEQNAQLGALAEAAGSDSISEFLAQLSELVERANNVRPGQGAAMTIAEGLQTLGSGREACVRLPPQPGQTRGSVAYSFIVTLTPEGLIVRHGDEEAFEASWTGALPILPYGTPISVADFNRLTRPFYDVGEDVGAPVPGSSTRRPCRFYIALQRSRSLNDVNAYDLMLRRVQDNFYKRPNVELVD